MGPILSERVLRHNSYGTSIGPSFFDKLEPQISIFAEQAALKGGIGEFVAQGLSKRGQNENPNSFFFSPACTQSALRHAMTESYATSGLNELNRGRWRVQGQSARVDTLRGWRG